MERFVKRHENRIVGSITGFDRMLFRGNISSICHIGGMDRFLSSQRVLYKDFRTFALKISSQVKAHAEEVAKRESRPIMYLPSSKQSKEETARAIMKRDNITEGLICVLTCIEPCQSFEIRKDGAKKLIYLVSAERKCLHIYFYFIDRECGFMHIRLQTWLPLSIQVCINGREWLACEMTRKGIKFTRDKNCFPWIEDIEKAQQLMDNLTNRKWKKFLDALARRTNPWLNPKGELVLKPYYWTMRASEYATDIMFKDQESLEEIYPALIRYTIEELGTEDVLRFLSRTKPHPRTEVRSSLQRRGDGVRVRHWVEENSIKMYNKGGNILRIETTINNPKRFKVRRRIRVAGKETVRWMWMRKGIADISRRVEVSRAANERHLQALAVVGDPTPSHKLLDTVSKRVDRHNIMYRALRPISPEESRLFQAVLKGENQIQGIRNKSIRNSMYPDCDNDIATRRKHSARSTRLLRLLQAHHLIYRVRSTNYYRITKKGHDIMGTALRFRQTELALLAA
jgi:hypothetical protein